MKMYLISDNVDTHTGMRLAGVEGVVIHTEDEFKKTLNDVLADREVGILLITEKLSLNFPETINGFKLAHSMPLVVEIPDRHGSGRRPDFITAYAGEAIGLKL